MKARTPPGTTKVSFLARPVEPWQRKFVGAIVLVIGILFSGLSLLAVARWLFLYHRWMPLRAVSIMAATTALGLVLLVVGERLVTGRSRHRDSLLSRPVWFVLAAMFVGMTVWMTTKGPLLENAIPVASGLLFSIACLGVALRPRSAADATDDGR